MFPHNALSKPTRHVGLILIHFTNVAMLKYGGNRSVLSSNHPIAEDMMRIDYGAHISQSTTALLALEKRLRGRPIADRIKLLRLRSKRGPSAACGLRRRSWVIANGSCNDGGRPTRPGG